jgi:large subunit ribosomal protein L23
MGLFGKKKDAKVSAPEAPKAEKVAVLDAPASVTDVILRPRVTEKAALLGERNVYAFEVKKGATKFEIRDAVKALYKVTPVRIRIVNKQPRHFMSRSRGRDMMEGGLRKAYVYLKKDDRIELV